MYYELLQFLVFQTKSY